MRLPVAFLIDNDLLFEGCTLFIDEDKKLKNWILAYFWR
jgi:hypothetical protein